MGNRKRLTAFLLTAVMILTMPQMQIAAAEVESPADVGLCIHHTQHTEDCGYTEGEKGTPLRACAYRGLLCTDKAVCA